MEKLTKIGQTQGWILHGLIQLTLSLKKNKKQKLDPFIPIISR